MTATPAKNICGLGTPLFLICLAMILAAPLLLTGCGGDDEASGKRGGKSDKSAGLSEALAEAKEYQIKAEALDFKLLKKSAKEDLEDAIASLKKAEDRQQTRYATRATNRFKALISVAEKRAADFKEVFVIKEKVDEKMAEARKKGVPEILTRDWETLEVDYANAVKRLSGTNPKSARNRFNNLAEDIVALEKGYLRALELKSVAEKARASMRALRDRASASEANEFAVLDMERAKDSELQGEDFFSQNKYKQAASRFSEAKRTYASALDLAIREKNKREGISSAEPINSGLDSPPEDDPGETDDAPEVGEIDVPDDNDSNTDGSVDIAANLGRLFSGEPEYDGTILTLNYVQDGQTFQKDAIVLQGKVGTSVNFTGDTHTGTEEYTLAGNQVGKVLLNAGFTDAVVLTAEINFQLFAAKSTFFLELVLNSDAKGKNYHALQIGSRGIFAVSYQDGNPRAAVRSSVKQHKLDVNRWLIKRESHNFSIRIAPNDKGKHVMLVKMDDKLILKKKIKRRKHGFVGFFWRDTKFYVTDFTAKGKVDEKWAEKILNKKNSADEPDQDTGLDF